MINRFAALGSRSWVRNAEHAILRVVSLVFSLASAYAIRLFFAPLDVADAGEKYITWGVAIGFGVLGYVVSRGLVHRMMRRESIWAYAPICLLVELVDISCNYVLAASAVRQAWWLNAVPANQHGVLTVITYVVLSAIPLVSLFLAVVDMDLERSKQGGMQTTGKPLFASRSGAAANGKPLFAPKAGQVPPPPPVRAGQVANGPGGNAATGTGANGAVAAKRAAYWNGGGPKQGSPTLAYDPDKDLAGAGIP